MAAKRKRDGVKTEAGAPGNDGLEQFRKTLQELKSNAQSKIKQLTALAETHKEFSEQLSHILATEIMNAQAPRLQPLVLVLDSIMKKLGKEYRFHLVAILPDLVGSVFAKADMSLRQFLQRVANDSWKKHDLLPLQTVEKIDAIFASGGSAPVTMSQVKTELQANQQVASSFVAVKDEQLAAAAAAAAGRAGAPAQPTSFAPPAPASAAVTAPPAAKPPPVKGPPPKPPVKLETQTQPTPVVMTEAASSTASATAASAQEELERRLLILTKIMERKGPTAEELREIMRVPEVVRAMTMQRQGAKNEAMAVLAEYKAELEATVERNRQSIAGSVPKDPRQIDPRQGDQKPTDPRAADPRIAADPRQPARADGKVPEGEARPLDPRQAARQSADPKGVQLKAAKREVDSQTADPRQKLAKAQKQVAKASADCIMIDDEDADAPSAKEIAAEKSKLSLQGLPSLGFSEGWLRQFMDQMPVKGSMPADGGSSRKQVPSVGRKVMSAEGEQMVYVDELSPSEILLLMQLIFLLEERLRRSGGGVDAGQRVPHTFGYLQVDPAIDVMLKGFFEELPHQCTQTGLRFSTREKLRKHHDAMYRRRATQQQRQRGAEARGWMETIPEWVGNRDLVVGPALFQLGGGAAVDEANAQRGQRASSSALEDAEGSDEEEEDSERARWICPLDVRRSVCPISGEPFERSWSDGLNDWAFSDVVALELGGADQVLRFPPKNPGDPEKLSETALIFKKSSFLNTSINQRLAALEDCRSVHALSHTEVASKLPEKASSKAADEDVAKLGELLAEARAAPRRKFF